MEIVLCSAYDGDEQPESKTLIDMMTGAFKDKLRRGEFGRRVFVLIFVLSRRANKTDAICACWA
jgi:hypothetical protein